MPSDPFVASAEVDGVDSAGSAAVVSRGPPRYEAARACPERSEGMAALPGQRDCLMILLVPGQRASVAAQGLIRAWRGARELAHPSPLVPHRSSLSTSSPAGRAPRGPAAR